MQPRFNVTVSVKNSLSEKEKSDRIKQFQQSFVEAAADYYSTNHNKPKEVKKVKILANKESA
jgi:hypothetical protein